eukprot:189300-Pelagomonas_calceolata.AAC.3
MAKLLAMQAVPLAFNKCRTCYGGSKASQWIKQFKDRPGLITAKMIRIAANHKLHPVQSRETHKT